MKWILGLLGAIVIIYLTATIGVGFYLSPQDELAKADAIVAISGGETTERTKEAVKLYHDGYAPLLIFSGAARDEGVSNAEAMKQIAISLGADEADIVVEEQAKDTFGNAIFVQEIADQYNLKSIILVTSPYHQKRAYLTFRKYLGSDVTIINHSATDSAWRKNGWWKNDWGYALTFSELRKILLLPVAFKLAN